MSDFWLAVSATAILAGSWVVLISFIGGFIDFPLAVVALLTFIAQGTVHPKQ